MSEKVGVLVDLEMCVGCYACQSACTMKNQLPVGKTYLRVVNCKPERVDGKLKMFMSPVPNNLERCAECVDAAEDGRGPCAKVCLASALDIAPASKILAEAELLGRHCALYL